MWRWRRKDKKEITAFSNAKDVVWRKQYGWKMVRIILLSPHSPCVPALVISSEVGNIYSPFTYLHFLWHLSLTRIHCVPHGVFCLVVKMTLSGIWLWRLKCWLLNINHFWKYQSLKMLVLWCAYNMHGEGQTDRVCRSIWDKGVKKWYVITLGHFGLDLSCCDHIFKILLTSWSS